MVVYGAGGEIEERIVILGKSWRGGGEMCQNTSGDVAAGDRMGEISQGGELCGRR